jgi:hypothetical protein
VEDEEEAEGANLVLSHVCHTGSQETPTPTPSVDEETPTPTPSVDEETPTPTPSVDEETPTPEQSVQGVVGTPAASVPDSAMGATGGPSPLPTLVFGLILLASLATLAWANADRTGPQLVC